MRLTCLLNVSGLRSKVLFASMELSTTAEEPHQPMRARQNVEQKPTFSSIFDGCDERTDQHSLVWFRLC
jgi:hypothetical protein